MIIIIEFLVWSRTISSRSLGKRFDMFKKVLKMGSDVNETVRSK